MQKGTEMYATRQEIINSFCTCVNDLDGTILRQSLERHRAIERIEKTKWELLKRCDEKEGQATTENLKQNSVDSNSQKSEPLKTPQSPCRSLGQGSQGV